MTDEINIELVEQTPLDVEFTETQLTIDLVEPSPIEIEFPNVGIPGVEIYVYDLNGGTNPILSNTDATQAKIDQL